jgi:hypothetical protein
MDDDMRGIDGREFVSLITTKSEANLLLHSHTCPQPKKIDIKLNSNDRFLTLIVTDGKDHTDQGDWTIFGKPALHLARKTDAIR